MNYETAALCPVRKVLPANAAKHSVLPPIADTSLVLRKLQTHVRISVIDFYREEDPS